MEETFEQPWPSAAAVALGCFLLPALPGNLTWKRQKERRRQGCPCKARNDLLVRMGSSLGQEGPGRKGGWSLSTAVSSWSSASGSCTDTAHGPLPSGLISLHGGHALGQAWKEAMGTGGSHILWEAVTHSRRLPWTCEVWFLCVAGVLTLLAASFMIQRFPGTPSMSSVSLLLVSRRLLHLRL